MLSALSAHTARRARFASAARRFNLTAPTTSLAISTSATPPSTSASASLTFWQHTPTAPERDLAQRDLRALMALRVRAQRDAPARKRFLHPAQIALESVELEDERGRVHFGERHADRGGKIARHGVAFTPKRRPSIPPARCRKRSTLRLRRPCRRSRPRRR